MNYMEEECNNITIGGPILMCVGDGGVCDGTAKTS